MLIGIDMLGVQSPGGDSRESGRLARQLVSALLANDPTHRYVLYTHEGLPTESVPSARNALRVTLAGVPGHSSSSRSIIQRVLDRNPDGLDWLVLLDPFDDAYGGIPPESPLNGVKVASLVTNLSSTQGDYRRLAPLRRHDAILAFSESTLTECRFRMPEAGHRIKRLSLALDDSWIGGVPSEPLSGATGDELGRLGISGPFLFANLASGAERSNLFGVLEAYQRLPIEHRQGHQLVVAGKLDDPWSAVSYLHDHGCAEGLVLVGPVDEPTLRTLYSWCSVFVSPSLREASELSLAEAMSRGAPLVAGRSGSQAALVDDAGLFADPSDPSEIARQVASLLNDVDLAREFRSKALVRSRQFTWGPVIKEFLEVLRAEEPSCPKPRYRFDRSHAVRPRIALFTGFSKDLDEFDTRFAQACLVHYDVDLYFESGGLAMVEPLSVEFGGFDARQFARNDEILDYHAVVYLLPDVFSLKPNLGRLDARPGLLILRDESSLARIEVEIPATGSILTDVEAQVACQRLRELFSTSCRIGVRSSRTLQSIRSVFKEFAEQVVQLPTILSEDNGSPPRRSLGASQPLAELIDGCSADQSGLLGRPRKTVGGRGTGSASSTHWSLSATDTDDWYLEAR